jgi:YD repeat-containing protein
VDYVYDLAGKIKQVTDPTGSYGFAYDISEQYTYDPIYQLTQVAQGTTTTESYSYDAVGNRLSSLGMSP